METVDRFPEKGGYIDLINEQEHLWLNETLWRAASKYTPEKVPLDSLPWKEDGCHVLGDPPTWGALASHCKLVQGADTEYPIIQGPSGDIVDGMHRIIKTYLEGKREIKCVKLAKMPTPDYAKRIAKDSNKTMTNPVPCAIEWVLVPAKDIEAARTFFGQVFGFTFSEYSSTFVPFQAANISGALSANHSPNPSGAMFSITVPNLDDWVALIQKHGCEFIKEPYSLGSGSGYCAAFRDPNGNQIEIYSKLRRPGS